MHNGPESSKLVELRSKTDRQLVALIDRNLAAVSMFAGSGDGHPRAESACEEIRRLLPFVPRADRRRFETRLAELGEILHPSARAACF